MGRFYLTGLHTPLSLRGGACADAAIQNKAATFINLLDRHAYHPQKFSIFAGPDDARGDNES